MLSSARELSACSVLEVGTGSGATASVLAQAVGPGGLVCAVDVHDLRIIDQGYSFCRVASVDLPFTKETFDVVVSNHVIEHVGARTEQLQHLREIRRVLKPEGIGYIAAPNRWRLVEPHYRLPLLSWLPSPWASRYLRAARRGRHYDCVPPSHRSIQSLFLEAELVPKEITYDAMRVMAEVEEPGVLAKALLKVPRAIFEVARPVIPTMIFLVTPQ